MSNSTELASQLLALQEQFRIYKQENNENNDAFFLVSMSLIIILMQCGFAFLEAGAVRSKNTTNIIFKNMLDPMFSAIGYWALGWGIAYGPVYNKTLGLFFGQGNFLLANFTEFPKFFFQYCFAATATTIVGGAVAERCEIICYVVYCIVISTFVYPSLTHWGWTDYGWMKNGPMGLVYWDFAGAGMVHLCGGVIALAGAWLIGPRIGRFTPKQTVPNDIRGHSVPFAALGGFILMFGFLAFNGGSMGTISTPGAGVTVALAMIYTTLCGAFASFTYLVIYYFTQGKLTLLFTINALLAGMVAACAGCDNSPLWTSIVTGTGASCMYLLLSSIMLRLRIDDPLDAFAVHFGGGFWGLFSTCFLRNDGIIPAIVTAVNGGENNVGHAFLALLWQMFCTVAIIAWSLIWMIPIFILLGKIGKMRVPREVEVKGLDIFKHGESAYPLMAYGHGWDGWEGKGAGNTITPNDFGNVRQRKMTVEEKEGEFPIGGIQVALEQLASAYSEETKNAEAAEVLRKVSVRFP